MHNLTNTRLIGGVVLTLSLSISSGCSFSQSSSSCGGVIFSSCHQRIKTDYQPTYSAWSPGGRNLAIVQTNRTLTVIDRKTGQAVIKDLAGPYGGVGIRSVKYSPNGQYLVYGINDINIYDAHTYHLLNVIKQPFKSVQDARPIGIWSLDISPDSKKMAVFYRDVDRHDGIAEFDLETGRVIWKKLNPPMTWTKPNPLLISTSGLFFSPDSNKILFCAGGYYYKGKILKRSFNLEEADAQSGKIKIVIENIDSTSPSAMAISHHGDLLAIGAATTGYDAFLNKYTKKLRGFKNDNSVKIYNLRTGKLRNVVKISGGAISLAFSRNENYLVISSFSMHASKNISIFNLKTNRIVQRLTSEPGMRIALNQSNSTLSATGYMGVYIFNRVKNDYNNVQRNVGRKAGISHVLRNQRHIAYRMQESRNPFNYVYRRNVMIVIAHTVRELRVKQEKTASEKSGHPVPLATGYCEVNIAVSASGIVGHAQLINCTSSQLKDVVLEAIKHASPFPHLPPHGDVNVKFRLRIPRATPGINVH